MKRRNFLGVLTGATSWPVMALAQQAVAKVARIGWLVTGSPASYRMSLASFLDGLKAQGYIEGQNIKIEYRWAEGDIVRLHKLADDLVEQKVDVILAGGSLGAEAAEKATSAIPIVAAGVGDLVELGLVTSLARPGGNLTGFVSAAPETTAKRFEIMKEIVPLAKHAVALWNPSSSNARVEWEKAEEFSKQNGVFLSQQQVHDIEEIKTALAMISQSDPDFLVVLNDPLVFTYRKIIVEAAGRLRLPSIYGYREFVDDGGLISYGASISNTYWRAAAYVDRILRGEKPADLPVQLPTKFELVVNLRTAKAQGFEFPATLLARADEVIE
jgi:putative tryptophan/tyrosine transport system substrate-binding protein